MIAVPRSAWRKLERALGKELGPELAFAREWVGDVAFIRLAATFSAEAVIVACGIQDAAEALGMPLRGGVNERDQQLSTAVADAHAAMLKEKL